MKKKLIMLALCASVAAMSIAGCSAADDAADKAGEVASEAGEAISQALDNAGDAVSGLTSDASSAAESSTDSSTSDASSESTDAAAEKVSTADQAVDVLKSGNEAYRSGTVDSDVTGSLRSDLAENGQTPHTTIITCSDSRVPPELIFNSDLGELFTIRTAGNVVDEFEIGSVEYAADHLHTPLVVVMGHSGCGAVAAAVEGHADGDIEDIVHEIKPSVDAAKETETETDDIAKKAEDLNIENSIKRLRTSKILSELESEGKIKILGAKYDINTGEVTFFDYSKPADTSTDTSSSDTDEDVDDLLIDDTDTDDTDNGDDTDDTDDADVDDGEDYDD